MLAGVFVFGVPVRAQVAEHIERFDTTIALKTDASARITEKIQYLFVDGTHHGIYRDIPVSYATGSGNKSIGITDVSITDAKGVSYKFATTRSGRNLRFRIGDPNAFVSGATTYIISYTVSRAVGYFDSFDEWYWNVTGLDWTVPVQEASAVVLLPKQLSKDQLHIYCYEGFLGSTQTCATDVTYEKGLTNSVSFKSNSAYAPGQGLTIAVGFPKGIVRQPTRTESIIAFAKDNWIVALPVIVFFGMFTLWYYKGRDPKGRGTIVPEYDSPDNLTPLEQYAVLHERVSNDAVSAEIIYLATKGYIKITKLDEKGLIFSHTDYELDKLKEGDDLPDFEKALLNGVFETGHKVKLSDLKNTFYKNLPAIKKGTIASVIAKKYFPNDPSTIRNLYIGGGVAFVFVVTYFGALLTTVGVVSVLLSGAIVVLFGLVMPKVTKEGAITREKIQGLKLYMDVAEKDRINFHNAPEKNPALFEKLLPFAMVLGVEKAWAKQFEGIYTQGPSWYSDPSGHAFSPIFFVNDMHSFSAGAAATLASAPGGSSGSGGGGSSGGGFGGGGGGSW